MDRTPPWDHKEFQYQLARGDANTENQNTRKQMTRMAHSPLEPETIRRPTQRTALKQSEDQHNT